MLRGFLPDAVKGGKVYLLKACSLLRLTYEIKLAAFMAKSKGMILVLDVQHGCSLSKALSEFAEAQRITINRGPP